MTKNANALIVNILYLNNQLRVYEHVNLNLIQILIQMKSK